MKTLNQYLNWAGLVSICVISTEIWLNPVYTGSPRPWEGTKTPSKTVIVLGQSCKRIHGSHSGLEKSSSQVAECDRCPLEDFSITPLSLPLCVSFSHPNLHPLSNCSAHPTHSALLVLLSWERAARGDPGLLNLLPKTSLLKCESVCVHSMFASHVTCVGTSG